MKERSQYGGDSEPLLTGVDDQSERIRWYRCIVCIARESLGRQTTSWKHTSSLYDLVSMLINLCSNCRIVARERLSDHDYGRFLSTSGPDVFLSKALILIYSEHTPILLSLRILCRPAIVAEFMHHIVTQLAYLVTQESTSFYASYSLDVGSHPAFKTKPVRTVARERHKKPQRARRCAG